MKKIVLAWIVLLLAGSVKSQSTRPLYLEYMTSSGEIQAASIFIEKMFYDSIESVWVIRDRSQYMPSIQPGKPLYKEKTNVRKFVLPDDRFMYSISRESFKQLKQDGVMDFEGRILRLASDANLNSYTINNKNVNVLMAENVTGRVKLWILDNPELPLLIKTVGCFYNGDIELINIK